MTDTKSAELFILTSDDDGHWYVIPKAKEREFSAWVDRCGDEEPPDWCESVGGSPSLVEFEKWRIR